MYACVSQRQKGWNEASVDKKSQQHSQEKCHWKQLWVQNTQNSSAYVMHLKEGTEVMQRSVGMHESITDIVVMKALLPGSPRVYPSLCAPCVLVQLLTASLPPQPLVVEQRRQICQERRNSQSDLSLGRRGVSLLRWDAMVLESREV